MGANLAKAIREESVNKGDLTGTEKKCVAPQTVAEKKMECVMKDIAVDSWAFRAGNSELQDQKGNILYKTESYSTNDKMFSVRCLDGATGQTLCIGVCKDVTSGTKTVVRILRPHLPAYQGQANFAKWAREDRGVPLYPFGTIEITNDPEFGSAKAKYSVTVEDDMGEPKFVPVYLARVYGDIASFTQYLMAVNTWGDNGKLVAKVDQPGRWDSKKLTLEAGQGVDVVAIHLLSLFFGVTKGMIW